MNQNDWMNILSVSATPARKVHASDRSEDLINTVWRKVKQVRCFTATDVQGNLISRREYGQQTEHGWEIDHILPRDLGGSDDISNLQPLHWRANRQKGTSLDPMSLTFLRK